MTDKDGSHKDHFAGIGTWKFHMGEHNEYYRTTTERDTLEGVGGSVESVAFR